MKDNLVKEFDAYRILMEINDTEFVSVLNQMNWSTAGPKDFLTGKVTATQVILDKFLSEKEAEQAVKEYKHALGYE